MNGVEGYMSTRQAAERWGRNVEVLRRMLKRGMVPGAVRNGTRGNWCIPVSDAPPFALPRRTKLAEEDRREIARLAHAGANRTELARAYGIKRLHVYHLMEKYPPKDDADGVLA